MVIELCLKKFIDQFAGTYVASSMNASGNNTEDHSAGSGE
jgi:hypothetical protein